MRYFVLFFSLINFSFCCFSQGDSLKIIRKHKLKIVNQQEIRPIPQITNSECAHSHICCLARCYCCRELSRTQQYDTIKTIVMPEVTRYVVTELLEYASSHEKSGIQYLFKKNKTGEIRKYYSVIHQPKYPNQTNGFQTGINYDGFGDGKEMVFDENYKYQYLDSTGNALPINYHSKVPISEQISLVWTLIGGRHFYDFVDANDQLIEEGFRFGLVDDFNHKKQTIAHKLDGNKVIVNSSGKIITKGKYSDARNIHNGYYAMRNKAGWWLFNSEGKKLSNQGFDHIGTMSEGMVNVLKKKKYGYLNGRGKLVIRCQFRNAMQFNDNRAAITFDNDVWGFIDKTGKLVIPSDFNSVRDFHGGLAPVGIRKNSYANKWGVIDIDGNFVIEPKYDNLSLFTEGYLKAGINGKGSGIIDYSGKVIVPCKFGINRHCSRLHDNIIVVNMNGESDKVMLYNLKGEVVAELDKYVYGKFTLMTNTSECIPYIHVQNKKRNIGLINTKGENLIPTKWEQMYVLDQSHALVNRGREYYIYNYLEGTRKALPKGHLQMVPSRGTFNFISEDNSQVIYYDYEGNVLESY